MANGTKGFLSIINTTVGRKILVAVTGIFLVLFVMAHLGGNMTILGGPEWINAYGAHLHRLPVLLWPFRVFLLAILMTHVFLGITLALENARAGKGKYAVIRRLKTTLSGRTMIWTGLFLLLFLALHIPHFSLRLMPGILVTRDGLGRLDIYSMIVGELGRYPVAVFYFIAVLVLFFHASHGVQSLFQTLGLANDRTLPKVCLAARILSAVLFIGYASIPILVTLAILK